MKNTHMQETTKLTITTLRAYQDNLRLAALADDGVIDDAENADMKQISQLTEAYIRMLKEITGVEEAN